MQPLPSFLRLSRQLEDHGQGGEAGATAFGLPGTMAHRRKSRFDGIGGANMPPVFGGEIVEGKQHLLVFGQALTGRRIFGLIAADKLLVAVEGRLLGLGPLALLAQALGIG